MAAETAEDRKAVFRRLIDCYARADVDAMEPLIAPDYIGHTSAGDRNWAEFRQSILNFHAIFDYAPDAFIVEDQFVDGEKVATRMTAHVRSRESGEPMTMVGINLAVIRGGQIVEEWNTWEMVQSAQSLSMQGA
ncbi:nuclear transport factor 2 family protein [Novosphingobium sp.]|uniref:ester cyclase n=1 Tax=Novosphingobium sp. TaxID=1874826 RepID=UPI001D5DAD76|nr:nuclear transport factor 2 family protein [Novosphingobium sp.]MBX9663138.1 ester cyclase [Novosphingobium sp.]